MDPLVLPQLKSRGSASVASKTKTGTSFYSQGAEEMEGKTMEELQKMLRQERLVNNT